jgi:hypothetical protein
LGGMELFREVPYASDGGTTSRLRPPTFIPTRPWSQPLMTCPAPRVNEKGSVLPIEVSNTSPF